MLVSDFLSFGPTAGLYVFLLFHLYVGSFSHILAIPSVIIGLIFSLVHYIFIIIWSLIYTLVIFCWFFVIFIFIRYVAGYPLYNASDIQAQLSGICNEQRLATKDIEDHIPLIAHWNQENSLLMKKIRAAEVAIKKKLPNYEPAADRVRFHPSGVQFMRHPMSHQLPEGPSTWAVVRWLKNQEDPLIFEARKETERLERVRRMKLRAFEYLKEEHEMLSLRLEETNRKKYAAGVVCKKVRFACTSPKASKNNQGGWVYQRPIVTEFTRRLDEARIHNNQIMHWCNQCEGETHTWLKQYHSTNAALEAPRFRACPSAAARLARMNLLFGLVPTLSPPAVSMPAPAPAPALRSLPASFFPAPVSTPAPSLATLPPLFGLPTVAAGPKTELAPSRSFVDAPAPVPSLATLPPLFGLPTVVVEPKPELAPFRPFVDAPAPAPAPAPTPAPALLPTPTIFPSASTTAPANPAPIFHKMTIAVGGQSLPSLGSTLKFPSATAEKEDEDPREPPPPPKRRSRQEEWEDKRAALAERIGYRQRF